MKIPHFYHIILWVIFILITALNTNCIKEYLNIHRFIEIGYLNNFFSVIFGFYLSALLALSIYNNQLEQQNIENRSKVLEYLKYLDENLKDVPENKLEDSFKLGYLNFDYFDNIEILDKTRANSKYFKLIGYLKYLKNIFYEVHNNHLLNPTKNPIRSDEVKLINNTINYIKEEIKKLQTELKQE